MNDQLQQTVNDILVRAVDAASQGAEFLQDQLPDVLKQLLLWKIGQHLTIVALILVALFVLWRIVKRMLKECYDEFPGWLVGGMGTMLFGVFLIKSIFELLQLWLAPKVWLLEYAASLVRGHS